MKLMLQLTKPEHLIPVHGELRHLIQHAALAREIGLAAEKIAVIENGTVVEFRDGKMSIGERIPGGYIFVDGSGVGDVGPRVMREREALARDGFVIVHLNLEGDGGKLIGEPEILTKGFVFVRDADELIGEASQRVVELVSKEANGNLPERIEKELGRFFYAETHRRPMIFIFVSQQS
jgi:ribonuclease J